jgi:tetratricopeptide (TPR) repeat protein
MTRSVVTTGGGLRPEPMTDFRKRQCCEKFTSRLQRSKWQFVAAVVCVILPGRVDAQFPDYETDTRLIPQDVDAIPINEAFRDFQEKIARGSWTNRAPSSRNSLTLPELPSKLNSDGFYAPVRQSSPTAEPFPLDFNEPVASASSRGLLKQFRFPRHNFVMEAPGAEWQNMPFMQRINPNAMLTLGVPFEEQFLQVIIEEVGTDAGFDTKMMQQLFVDNMRLGLESAEISEPEPLQIDGMNGLKTTIRGGAAHEGQSQHLTYVTWICVQNGISWQLASWTPVRLERNLQKTWETIPQRFHLIDRERVLRNSDHFSVELMSERFGVKANLTGTKFFLTPNMYEGTEDSRLISVGGGDSSFEIYPYALPDDRPSQKTVVECLLKMSGADVDKARLNAKRVRHGSLEAIEYQEGLSDERPHRQRFFRICFSDSCAWMIHCNVDSRGEDPKAVWTRTIDQVQLTPPESFAFDQFSQNDRTRHSALYLELGMAFADQGQIERTARYALLAHQINPDDLPVHEEVIDRLLATRQFSMVMPLLENLPPGLAIDPARRAQQAWVLSQIGHKQESITKYEELFQAGFEREDHLVVFVQLLSEAGRTDDALAFVDRQLEKSPSVGLATVRAEILIAGNRNEEAIADLRQRRDESPLAGDEYSIALIDTLLQAEQHHAAMDEVQVLERSGKVTPKLLLLKGIAQFKLERFIDARKSFETTLEEVPDLPLAKQFLELIASRLGQGDVSAVLEKIGAVPLPADVVTRNQPPASLRQEDGFWVELDARSIAYHPGKEFKTTRTQIIHVLNRSAVETFGRLQFDFDSLSEKFYVNRAEVYDKEGTLIGSTDPRDCFVLANEDDGLATNQKTLNVPLPGLRPGCRIEYQVTWQRHTVPNEFPNRRYTTTRTSPTSHVVVSVTGDLATLRWTGPQPTQIQNGFLWNIPAARLSNEGMTDDLVISPDTICLGDNQTTWQKIATDYVDDIRDRMAVSPAARSIVGEQLANAETLSDSEKVNRLAEWVRRELTYQGIEFGQRAWVMPPVEETLRNRYGDCKDHSLLLWQLLNSAGIKAHLALISAAEPLELRLPSAGQFDHMIVYVEDDLGTRFIDCTDKNVAGSIRVPMGLALKVALVLDPENPRLSRLPDYPADYNQVWVDRSVTLNAEGAAEIDETLWFGGYMASFMRQIMESSDREGQKSLVRSLLPATANAAISDLSFESPADLSQQPILRVKYSTPHYVNAVPGQLIGRVNVLDGLGGVTAVAEETREQPFRLRMPLDTSARIRIKAPEGFRISDTPERQTVQTAVLDAVRETSADADSLEMRIRLRRRTARLQPSSWANWRSTCQQVNDLLTPNLILSK